MVFIILATFCTGISLGLAVSARRNKRDRIAARVEAIAARGGVG